MGIIRSLIERRSTLANPAEWLVEALVGNKAASGVSVTPATAMQSTAVFACVRVLAETVASLPLHVYRRLPQGGKERATGHYLYPILHDAPNPEMTSFELRETLMGHLCLWGNAYCEIVRDGGGRARELWPLRPDKMTVQRESGDVRYHYRLPDGTTAVLQPQQVMHIRGLGGDGIVGHSPIRLAREAIGLALATEEFGAGFFSQGAHPGGIIEYPGKLSDQAYDRYKKSVQEAYGGLGKAHRLMVLEEGLKYTQVGIPPEDAQFLSTREFQVIEIARIYRVPPYLLQDFSRATFCLPADVEVFTEHGPKSVAELQAGERVWSQGTDGWVLAPVVRSACTGEDEILTIRTENRIIRANARHRILARRRKERPLMPGERGGWGHDGKRVRVEWVTEYVPAGELQVGDTIVEAEGFTSGGAYETPTRRASAGFMEFCGLYLGDGYMTNGHVAIARAKHAPYMDHYCAVMQQEFVAYACGNGRGTNLAPTKSVTLTEGERYTRFASVLAAAELRELGLGGTAHTKRVPGWVFGMADELKLAFLRGFLDADGSVNKEGRISFASCNRELLSGIRHLCIMLGIPVTNLRSQRGTTRLPSGRRVNFESWTFTCSDPGANRRIGSHTPIYQERLKNGKPFRAKTRRYPRHGGRGFSEPGCSLARIVSIEREPSEPVYDLEVAGTHSFIANGVVVHNSNVEHTSISFVVHTVRPWLVRFEQAMKRDLIPPSERQEYFAEFLVDGLLRGDIQSRYNAYAVGRQNGWLSADDIREMENMNPLPEGQGKVYLVPLNMVPAADLINGAIDAKPTSPAPGDTARGRIILPLEERQARSGLARRRIRRAYTRVIEDAALRVIRREKADILREAEKQLEKRGWQSFDLWLERFYEDHREFIERNMGPVFQSMAALVQAEAAKEVGGKEGLSPMLEANLRTYLTNYVLYHTQDSLGQIRAVIRQAQEQGQPEIEALQQRLEEWEQKRPAKVATWESVALSEAVAAAVYEENQIQRIRWSAVGSSCPWCQRMDGRVVGIKSHFVNKGDAVQADGVEPMVVERITRHPPLHLACDCFINAEV